MYDEEFLKEHYENLWSCEYYPSLCYDAHPAFIEENKKTVKEEDEDE